MPLQTKLLESKGQTVPLVSLVHTVQTRLTKQMGPMGPLQKQPTPITSQDCIEKVAKAKWYD